MKVKGQFLVYVSDPDKDKYHPEGDWGVETEDGVVKLRLAAEATQDFELVTLKFSSGTGKTGGSLVGHFVADRLFQGEGEVWGAGHSGWQAGGLFAPRIHPCRVWAISPQTYVGSLPGMNGQPIAEAKAAYDALCATKAESVGSAEPIIV